MSLMIKYGLGPGEPTEKQKEEWLNLVLQYIKKGIGEEKAGEMAAQDIFKSYMTRVYDSQADTIADLITKLRTSRGK